MLKITGERNVSNVNTALWQGALRTGQGSRNGAATRKHLRETSAKTLEVCMSRLKRVAYALHKAS